MLRRASPSGFLPNIGTSSDRSREFPDTSCSSVADGSCQTGGPFLLRNGVGALRSATDSRFFINSVLDEGCTKGSSSSSSETIERSGRTRGLSSSSSSSSRDCELGMQMFAPIEQKFHVSLGEETAHAIWAGMQDSSNPKPICPTVEYSAGEEYKPKAGHVILTPFGSNSTVIPKFY